MPSRYRKQDDDSHDYALISQRLKLRVRGKVYLKAAGAEESEET